MAINGNEIATDDNEKAVAWKAAKHAVFELCHTLQPLTPWRYAFNVAMDMVKHEHEDADPSPEDVELWCKEAYKLFQAVK